MFWCTTLSCLHTCKQAGTKYTCLFLNIHINNRMDKISFFFSRSMSIVLNVCDYHGPCCVNKVMMDYGAGVGIDRGGEAFNT